MRNIHVNVSIKRKLRTKHVGGDIFSLILFQALVVSAMRRNLILTSNNAAEIDGAYNESDARLYTRQSVG